jgi:hypothetical protein
LFPVWLPQLLTKTSKNTRPGLLAGHPFSSETGEKAASASGELANNFPANADLEAALHGPGEWFMTGKSSRPAKGAWSLIFLGFPLDSY